MKILVTGYKGFIGSNLYETLKHHGYEVDGYDWDCYWYEQLKNVKKYDMVKHLGAISSTTETDIEKIMLQNYDYTVLLYEECCRQGVDLQFASSGSLYGMGTNFKEDALVDPRTPYAWSKYLCERYMSKHILRSDTSIRVQIFRYFNVYGPNEDHKGTQASPFNQFYRQVRELGYCKVFEGSENFKRDFVPVSKVCDTHMMFMRCPESGTWNVGTGKTLSFLDVAKMVAPEYKEIPFPEHLKHSYQKYTCADLTKLNETIQKYGLHV